MSVGLLKKPIKRLNGNLFAQNVASEEAFPFAEAA